MWIVAVLYDFHPALNSSLVQIFQKILTKEAKTAIKYFKFYIGLSTMS